MKNLYEMVATYDQIKEIIDEAEEKRQHQYEECINNNWVGEISDMAMNIKVEAYKQIEKLTKD